jgi:hypothetical protein
MDAMLRAALERARQLGYPRLARWFKKLLHSRERAAFSGDRTPT